MAFGDEGKGTFVDYLANTHRIKNIIRYNGGSQASHTVITPGGILHKFSQLGSGMFFPESRTFLTQNMVVDPDSIVGESREFGIKTGYSVSEVLERIFIHEDCYFVTPYHRLTNKLRELCSGENKRGSTGSGVSEVMVLMEEESLGVQMKDLYNPEEFYAKLTKLHEYLAAFYEVNRQTIEENMVDEIKDYLQEQIGSLTDPSSVDIVFNYFTDKVSRNKINICSDFSDYLSDEEAIYEGTQGLLLDCQYGFHPNTTKVDNTNHFAVEMLKDCQPHEVSKIGILKAFTSRHGCGVFPTESKEVASLISDPNQDPSYWNGGMRFGWFDAVLARYAQEINQVDQIFLSSLDLLGSFPIIRICDSYIYLGEKDQRFEELFEYENADTLTVVKNIKQNKGITPYLEKCLPVYTEVKGWNCDISEARKKEQLPDECRQYIKLVQKYVGVLITVVSVGPTRMHKIRMW
ncbi:MAG: adenylosuccinate synthetase [Ignavibacteriales bacterium]